ncbi:MAG: pyruvate kinase, partial [Candidatus Cloacimonadaceae bacterium]|nr:pyruvate kinase [Candidatus Cloacimonadaceae bacterium]
MSIYDNKTKIVCTIGPATDSTEVMIRMIESGMNIARLNYAHGDFEQHAKVIKRLRAAAKKAGTDITIMADLPGPKIRIGLLKQESIILHPKDQIILTTEKIIGDWTRVSVTLPQLPKAVRHGDIIFLNDGLIQLKVREVENEEIICDIVVGGELRSNKGLNLPDTDLGISAFTERDAECLRSALESGVDAVSQSFVNGPEDILAVRKAARELGYDPFIIAKMERSGALDKIDEILHETDGMMIARGDLGVEIPIERLAIVQKRLIARANLWGKPVITATQMLESMVRNPRPTRAEATDVANAVLDGTDCLMLSEESAIGKYPIDAIKTLARIAAYTEANKNDVGISRAVTQTDGSDTPRITDIIAADVAHTVEKLKPELLIAHTVTGHTARMISRYKPSVWILAVSLDRGACRGMQFSYGVKP